MKKQKYLTPATDAVNLQLADRILGASDWFLLGGEGNFDYDVTEDTTWE